MPVKEFQNELFNDEVEILEKALADISNAKYSQNELIDKYSELANSYGKLLKLTKKVFKISDTQGKELKRCANEIKVLLDNSNQGFLTFGKDLLVNKEYSSECLGIFNKKITGCNIAKLLCESCKSMEELFEEVFNKVFMAKDMEEKNSLLKSLPGMLRIDETYVDAKYKLVSSDDTEEKNDLIMMILTDITEKRKAEDQILYLSYHDKLTTLYNRAYVENLIPQLQTDIRMPLSIIMADMNGLKLTNDVFGHEYGDKLLVSAAKTFMSCSRSSDIIARWGGDEFLIVMPNADSKTCKELCERIKEMCNEVEPDPIQLSVSLGSATMESSDTDISKLLSMAENMMYSIKIIESKNVRKKIILSMEKILHTKCYEDVGHIERIKKMAFKFAEVLGEKIEADEMEILTALVAFHDIGKVAVPREILSKKSHPLTGNEWEIMKRHTEIGFRMAQSIDEPVLAKAILALRERWDGSGYPYGLKHDQIPYISRVIAIIEAFDVMTHHRPYKSAISKDDAKNELNRCSGTQFDPELVGEFLKHFDEIVE